MTPEQADQIRRLADAAGGRDELICWVKQALPKPTGRPRGSGRFRDLDVAVLAAAKAASDLSGTPVATLLRANVAMMGAAVGASPEAAVERLQLKARGGGPTETEPNRAYCKDDQSCCDFVCGN